MIMYSEATFIIWSLTLCGLGYCLYSSIQQQWALLRFSSKTISCQIKCQKICAGLLLPICLIFYIMVFFPLSNLPTSNPLLFGFFLCFFCVCKILKSYHGILISISIQIKCVVVMCVFFIWNRSVEEILDDALQLLVCVKWTWPIIHPIIHHSNLLPLIFEVIIFMDHQVHTLQSLSFGSFVDNFESISHQLYNL